MSQLNTGQARANTRVMKIALFGMLFLGIALLVAFVPALPGGATSASEPPLPEKGNQAPASPAMPNDICGQVVPSPNVGPQDNSLSQVAAVSGNDVWAVGTYHPDYDTILTLIEHWNGSVWTVVSSPNPSAINNSLNGVAAVSANNVWAVGYYHDGSKFQTLVEHWNGTTWSVVSSPNPGAAANYLNGVAAVAANDVWAVGHFSGGTSMQTLVEHWNGTAWSVVPSPNLGSGNNYLQAVAVVSADNVWAVGFHTCIEFYGTLVLHWNGTAWSVVLSPDGGLGDSTLSAVDGVAPDDVWAVGSYFDWNLDRYQALIEHWNGTTWSVVSGPNPGAYAWQLHGVVAVSANDVWAVGWYTRGALVEHWNGTAWSVVQSPDLPGTYSNYLTSVAALSANYIWAVGDYQDSSDVHRTLVERYMPCGGATPTPVPATPTPCTAGHFSDVPPGSTFYPYITCLADRRIISGYSDCSFKPNNPITRGQLAKIVSSAAGFNDPQSAQLFQDVPDGSTFFQYIGRLASRGYMSGYPCGGTGEQCMPPGNLPYFRTNNNATRGQISKIVSNAAGFSDPPSGQLFQDVPPGSTFYDYIQRLASRTIMSGYPCGRAGEPCGPGSLPYFRPNNNATRGQVSKIVSNTFFPGCEPLAAR